MLSPLFAKVNNHWTESLGVQLQTVVHQYLHKTLYLLNNRQGSKTKQYVVFGSSHQRPHYQLAVVWPTDLESSSMLYSSVPSFKFLKVIYFIKKISFKKLLKKQKIKIWTKKNRNKMRRWKNVAIGILRMFK